MKDDFLAVSGRAVQRCQQDVERFQSRIRARLQSGYDPKCCMGEVRGRQCSHPYRWPSDDFGNVIGFCPQHEPTVFDSLREALERQRRDAAIVANREARYGARSRSKSEGAGVYVVRAKDSVKIGRTVNRDQRMATLRTGSSEPLELVAWIPANSAYDAADIEAALHERFKDARTSGEWFRLTPEVQAWIDGQEREHGRQ